MILRVKKIFCFVLCFLSSAAVLTAEASDSHYDDQTILRIMTYNIRFNTSRDGLNAWPYRKEAVAGLIRFHRADIIGLQEPDQSMVDDLQNKLPEYQWCSCVAQDSDGEDFWPTNPIFYRTSRLKLLDKAYFWLREISDKETVSREKLVEYTTVWGLFQDLRTHRKFYVFNVHFDWHAKMQQRENAQVLLEKVKEISGETPAFIIGDFNTRENSATYHSLTYEGLGEGKDVLIDSKFLSDYGHYGPEQSFGGFSTAGYRGKKIDYIFVRNNIHIVQHGILSDTYDDNRWPSDHLPVMVEALVGLD